MKLLGAGVVIVPTAFFTYLNISRCCPIPLDGVYWCGIGVCVASGLLGAALWTRQ